MHANDRPPILPVGKFKSFGPYGPKYQIGLPLRRLADGDWLVEVTLIESGEKVEHRWTQLMEDPQAL